jgi:hypothetical protein
MHDATTLILQNGPVTAPIFIPTASTDTPFFDCPLTAFNAMVDRAIDIRFLENHRFLRRGRLGRLSRVTDRRKIINSHQ